MALEFNLQSGDVCSLHPKINQKSGGAAKNGMAVKSMMGGLLRKWAKEAPRNGSRW